MKSNRIYHYFFKYSLLGFSILFVVWSIVSWVAPEYTIVNGKPGTRDLATTLVFGAMALIVFLLHTRFHRNFAIVELGNQTIKVKQDGLEKSILWMDVEEIQLIQFVFPPLYKLRIKDVEEAILFNTEHNYISIGGFMRDTSDMGALIRKKKSELGI